MASLVSENEKKELRVIFEDIFDTFKRKITVHKEPIKTVSNIDINFIFGYGEPSHSENITYTPQSQDFYATISYSLSASDTAYVQEISSYVPGSLVRIKVEESTKNYIMGGGKTEFVEFDGKKFNLISKDIESNFLDVCFFVFFLKVAN